MLAYGSHPEDGLLADAYRRSAKRFGARIVKELQFKDTGGARQTDSGVVQTQQQMPVFTQGLPDYDVLVTADENEVFAGYLPYRTWDARPVVGSAGLASGLLEPQQRILGRRAASGSLHPPGPSPHDAARYASLDRMPHDRRSGEPRRVDRSLKHHAEHEEPRFRHRRLQRAKTHSARLGPAASPADSAGRWTIGGIHLAATRLSAPSHRARYARFRSSRKRGASCDARRLPASGPDAAAAWLQYQPQPIWHM